MCYVYLYTVLSTTSLTFNKNVHCDISFLPGNVLRRIFARSFFPLSKMLSWIRTRTFVFYHKQL